MNRSAGRVGCVASLLGAAFALTLAGAAHANTLTLGSDFAGGPMGSASFTQPATVVETSDLNPFAEGSTVAGTVIEWRFSGGGGDFLPKVIRPVGTNQYVGVRTGPAATGTGLGNVAGPFPISLPIERGDLFGVTAAAGTDLGVISTPVFNFHAFSYFIPPLTDGGPPRSPDAPTFNAELAVSATVRFCLVPNLKGRSPGSARRRLRERDCTIGKTKRSKKVRDRRKVLSVTPKAQTPISDTEPVKITISRTR